MAIPTPPISMGFFIRKFLIEYSCRYQVGKIITMVNRLDLLSNLGPNYVMIPKVTLNIIGRMRSMGNFTSYQLSFQYLSIFASFFNFSRYKGISLSTLSFLRFTAKRSFTCSYANVAAGFLSVTLII